MILDMTDYAFNLILVFFSKTFQKLASCHQTSPQSITTMGKKDKAQVRLNDPPL